MDQTPLANQDATTLEDTVVNKEIKEQWTDDNGSASSTKALFEGTDETSVFLHTAVPSNSPPPEDSNSHNEDDDYFPLLFRPKDRSVLWLWLDAWTKRRRREILVVFFGLLGPLGLVSLSLIFKGTDSTMKPIEGSLSAEAINVYANAGFEDSSSSSVPTYVLFHLADGQNGCSSLTETNSPCYNETRAYVMALATSATSEKDSMVFQEHYYNLVDKGYPELAKTTLSSSDGRTVVGIAVGKGFTKDEIDTVLIPVSGEGSPSNSSTKIKKIERPSFLEVSQTGLELYQRDMKTSSARDLSHIDTISLPISLTLFAVALGSTARRNGNGSGFRRYWRLLMLPVINILTATLLWSILLCWVIMDCFGMPVTQFTPSIMTSLTLAMSIDYSLFYLSRLVEELEDDSIDATEEDEYETVQEEIRFERANSQALMHAGHSILVSGTTLTVCLLGSTILPVAFLRSLAVGSAAAVSSCIAVHLLLLPALLHTPWVNRTALRLIVTNDNENANASPLYEDETTIKPPSFQEQGLCQPQDHRVKEASNNMARHPFDEVEENHLHHLISGNCHANMDDELDKLMQAAQREKLKHMQNSRSQRRSSYSASSSVSASAKNPWRIYGTWVLKRPYQILIATTLALLPIALFCLRLDTTMTKELMLPRTSASLKAFHRAIDEGAIPQGAISPFKFLFQSVENHSAGEPMDSALGFAYMHKVILDVAYAGNPPPNHTMIDVDEKQFISCLQKQHFPLIEGITAINDLREAFSNSAVEIIDALKQGDLISDTFDSKVPSLSSCTFAPTVHPNTFDVESLRRLFVNGNDGYDFSLNQLVHQEVVSDTHLQQKLSSFSGVAVLNGFLIPYPLYQLSLLCEKYVNALFATQNCPIEAMRTLALIANRTVSHDRHTVFVTAILDEDPYLAEGVEWVQNTRKILDSHLEKANSKHNSVTFTTYLYGEAATEYDAVEAINHAMPKMIALTTIAVAVLISLAFRSPMVALRSVVSIGITLATVYGFANLVFGRQLFFLPPVMAFTAVVGLSLDYDVFLTTRILEQRDCGMAHGPSILAGLQLSGDIITSAGAIMCVAFGGLLFSPTPVLVQFSTFLVASVVLDTLLVRTTLMPILLHLSGDKWAWWPRTFPSQER